MLGRMIIQFSVQSIDANELKTFLGLFKIVGVNKVCNDVFNKMLESKQGNFVCRRTT